MDEKRKEIELMLTHKGVWKSLEVWWLHIDDKPE